MTPDRAATLFRELLQTPREQFGHFAGRAGLHTRPEHLDLEQAQELLFVIAQALESSPGPEWERVRAAWTGLRQRHGQTSYAVEPKPPEWVRELPAKPTLGDAAPGTAGYEQQQRERARFVPQATPARAPMPIAPPAMLGPMGAVPAMPGPTPAAMPAAAWPSAPAAPAAPAYGESYAVGPPPAPMAPSPGYGPPPGAAPPPRGYGPPPAPPVRPLPPPAGPAARLPPPAPPAAAAPAQSPDGGWTVSKYAAFCAACAAYPERVLETQQQYGVADAMARARLDDWWAERFDDDPSLQEQWERLVAQFRDQLRRR